jgi:hypothetical protein
MTGEDDIAAAAAVLAEAAPLLSSLVPTTTQIQFQELRAFEESKVRCRRLAILSLSHIPPADSTSFIRTGL